MKLRTDLIPPEVPTALAEVLTFGLKYGERNWERGISANRIYAATLRHLYKFWLGEKVDSESGISHLKHALCNIGFLVTYEERKMLVRDVVGSWNVVKFNNWYAPIVVYGGLLLIGIIVGLIL